MSVSVHMYHNGATVHFEPEPVTYLRKEAEQASVRFLRLCFLACDVRTLDKAAKAVTETVGKLRASGEEW